MLIREYKTRSVAFQNPKSNWTVPSLSVVVLHPEMSSWSEKL